MSRHELIIYHVIMVYMLKESHGSLVKGNEYCLSRKVCSGGHCFCPSCFVLIYFFCSSSRGMAPTRSLYPAGLSLPTKQRRRDRGRWRWAALWKGRSRRTRGVRKYSLQARSAILPPESWLDSCRRAFRWAQGWRERQKLVGTPVAGKRALKANRIEKSVKLRAVTKTLAICG